MKYFFQISALFIVSLPAQAEIYRCPQADGSILLSDKECSSGVQRDGNRWVGVEVLRRQKAEIDAQRKLDENKRAQLERDVKEGQNRALQIRIEREVEAEMAAKRRSTPVSPEAINRMTTYAVVLGRSLGCGIDVQRESKKVGAWFDENFPIGESNRTYLPIFANGIQQHAQIQRSGKSPDSCGTVRNNFSTFPWP